MAVRAGENQKLKMLYIMKIFEEETDDLHALTMPEIIDRLAACGVNADRKTLYEDFRLLREYGCDIIAEKEGKITYYHLGSRDFELPELKLLVDAVQSSRFITDRKSKELIKKLENLVSRHEGSKLQRQVLIAGREKIIHYRVDKMTGIGISDEPREGQEEFRRFNIAHYTNTLFGMYAGDETKVTLEAEKSMVGVIIDRFGKDIIIAPDSVVALMKDTIEHLSEQYL